MESPRLLVLQFLTLDRGVIWMLSLFNCLISRRFFVDSGMDCIVAYNWARATCVSSLAVASAVSLWSTKLNTVWAVLVASEVDSFFYIIKKWK